MTDEIFQDFVQQPTTQLYKDCKLHKKNYLCKKNVKRDIHKIKTVSVKWGFSFRLLHFIEGYFKWFA